MHSTKKFFLLVILFATFLVACDRSTVSVSVTEMRKGRVEIDGIPIENLTTEKYSESSGDTLYHLSLKKGDHSLRVITNHLNSIDTTFRVASGESYVGIDMETGSILF